MSVRLARRTAAALTVLMFVAGCSGGGSSSGGNAAGSVSAAGAASAARSSTTRANAGRSQTPALTEQAVDVQRSIIYTADLTVRVADVDRAAARAATLASTAHGYVFSEQTSGGRQPTADITVKVPTERFSAVLAALGRLGTREDSTQQADDVTSAVVDLRSRVATERASVARVRTLLRRATSVGDVVDIEGELTKREASLESLEGRLAVLTHEVAYATITAHLMPRPKTALTTGHGHLAGFLGGLRGGWDAFVTFGHAVLTGIGAVLPFAATLAVLAALGWWLRRLLHGRRTTATSGG